MNKKSANKSNSELSKQGLAALDGHTGVSKEATAVNGVVRDGLRSLDK